METPEEEIIMRPKLWLAPFPGGQEFPPAATTAAIREEDVDFGSINFTSRRDALKTDT